MGAAVYAPPAMVWEGYARFDSVTRAVATGLKTRYVPVSDSAVWKLDAYAGDDPIHFNDQGASRFAHQLARAILSMPEVLRRAAEVRRGAR